MDHTTSRTVAIVSAVAVCLSAAGALALARPVSAQAATLVAAPSAGATTTAQRSSKRLGPLGRARLGRTAPAPAPSQAIPGYPGDNSLLASPDSAAKAGAGASGRGIDPTYLPTGDVQVAVGALTQNLIDASPEGTRFVLQSGVHRLVAPLKLRSRQQLLGAPGAVLNGSKRLTGWTSAEGAFSVAGQSQRLSQASAPGYTICLPEAPLCNAAEDVFVDGVPLRQVGSRAELGAGRFWFDYTTSRIWLSTDPTGSLVETTVAGGAIVGTSGNVVRNLVIEKFGNAVQAPAVHGSDMQLIRSEIRLNHGQGVALYGGTMVGNIISHNGQLGIGGGGKGLVVENNEISWNNAERVNPAWEAGGTKWSHSTNLVVRWNWVHHNWGSGFTTDINNVGTLYEANLVEDNGDIGIMHEISYDAVLRENIVRRNGQRDGWFPSRVGINITNSANVQVFQNVVEDNAGGGILGAQDVRGNTGGSPLGPWHLSNLEVHDNLIRATGAGGHYQWQTGLDIHKGVLNRQSFYATKGNYFRANTYRVPTTSGLWFLGDGGDGAGAVSVAWDSWRARQDAGSTLAAS